MRQFFLIHDPQTEASMTDRLLQLFAEGTVQARPFSGDWAAGLSAETVVVVWLGDAELSQLIPVLIQKQCALALLPHPQSKQAQLGFGIVGKVEDAVADVLAADGPVDVDLLHCNGRLALNSVVIGDPFSVTAGSAVVESVQARMGRFLRLARELRAIVLRPLRLTTHKENTIDTAAIGLVAVQHGRSSTMTRRVLGDSAVNDGMLDALVLSPRCVLQVLGFVFMALFLRPGRNVRLPCYLGHIRTESLRVTSQQPIGYLVDGVAFSDQELELRVDKQVLRLFRGRNLSVNAKPPDAKESFRVQALPVGEARAELTRAPLPWLLHASTEEFKELFQLLRQNARTSSDYLVLMLLSTLLATFGLFANSAPVIIGAMILAPLMSPMISLAMGLLRRESDLLMESGKSLLWGIALALAGSAALTLLTPLQTINSEISARLTPTLLDLGVAVVSGIAGAYAHARSEVARSLAGVAIAVALVPPWPWRGSALAGSTCPCFWAPFCCF